MNNNTTNNYTGGNPTVATENSTNPQSFENLNVFFKGYLNHLFEDNKPEFHKKINDLANSIKLEMKEVKNNLLTSLCLFVAFLTFFTVSINIFKETYSWQGITIITVVWLFLVGFVYLFYMIVNNKFHNWKYWIPITLLLLCLFCYVNKLADIDINKDTESKNCIPSKYNNENIKTINK